ncbi:hypothetical protein PQR39_25725 [Paraburkholderia sediminicola]|uniref:hypothetical protein n=1 Tax=Paraburkholderia sediminicola TaxID=458836 RepID=UPI0038B84C6E
MEMTIPNLDIADGDELVKCEVVRVKGYNHSLAVPERAISHAEADQVNALLRRNGITDLTAICEPLPKRRSLLSRIFG